MNNSSSCKTVFWFPVIKNFSGTTPETIGSKNYLAGKFCDFTWNIFLSLCKATGWHICVVFFRFLHVWCWTHCWLFKPLLWHLCWHCGQWSCPRWCSECQPLCQDPHCWNFRQCHWTVWSDRSHLAGKAFSNLAIEFLPLLYNFNMSCCGHGLLNMSKRIQNTKRSVYSKKYLLGICKKKKKSSARCINVM